MYMTITSLYCAGAPVHNSNKVDVWPLNLSIGLMGLVIAAVIVTFTIITLILVRAKSKVQEELRRCKAFALYDEVGTPPLVIDSSKNVAYVSTIKRVDEKPTHIRQ